MKAALNASLTIAVLVCTARVASAQEGQIAGTVRDGQGGVMPGVLIEVTSPALISKVRSATTDGNGQYRITNLPVGRTPSPSRSTASRDSSATTST